MREIEKLKTVDIGESGQAARVGKVMVEKAAGVGLNLATAGIYGAVRGAFDTEKQRGVLQSIINYIDDKHKELSEKLTEQEAEIEELKEDTKQIRVKREREREIEIERERERERERRRRQGRIRGGRHGRYLPR